MKTKNQSQKDKGGTALGKDGNLTHEPVTNNAMVSRHGGGETSSDTLKSDDEIWKKLGITPKNLREVHCKPTFGSGTLLRAIALTREACEKNSTLSKVFQFEEGQKAERERILEMIDRMIRVSKDELIVLKKEEADLIEIVPHMDYISCLEELKKEVLKE